MGDFPKGNRVAYRVTEIELVASFRFPRADGIEGPVDQEVITRIIADLTENMDSIQAGVSDVSEAIRQRYFPVLQAPVWVREDA